MSNNNTEESILKLTYTLITITNLRIVRCKGIS